MKLTEKHNEVSGGCEHGSDPAQTEQGNGHTQTETPVTQEKKKGSFGDLAGQPPRVIETNVWETFRHFP